jgi:hypothetical protein
MSGFPGVYLHQHGWLFPYGGDEDLRLIATAATSLAMSFTAIFGDGNAGNPEC